MTISIEQKRREIAAYIANNPSEGHPHYWCGGTETDCDSCNMDHPMTDLHISMLEEEGTLFQDIRQG